MRKLIRTLKYLILFTIFSIIWKLYRSSSFPDSHNSREEHPKIYPKNKYFRVLGILQNSEVYNHSVRLGNKKDEIVKNKFSNGYFNRPNEKIKCDSSCQEFRETLKNWPVDKPKAAIYVMTKPTRFESLLEMLKSLDTHFNDKYDYPVIIFHEKDFDSRLEQEVRRNTKSKLYFQTVTFTEPSFLLNKIPSKILCTSSIGYRHMCRFQAKLVYDQPIIQDLDYCWRLDDDSKLLSPVPKDLFQIMREQELEYGYVWQHKDARICTKGLWDAARRHIETHNITPQYFDKWKEPNIYYNNFEISKIDFWKSSEYQTFIEYIDRLGGIFYHRWGDAPIKGIALAIFMPEIKTKLFTNIEVHYQHGVFVNEF